MKKGVLMVLPLLFVGPLFTYDRPAFNAHQGRSEVMAREGMIATSQPLASAAGLQVLMEGGNAVDAAVTAAMVLSVVEPMMTGAGGDLFALVWEAEEGRLHGLNASGFAGSRADLEHFRRRGLDSIPLEGVEAVSVPGAVEGWNQLLSRFGSISAERALAPAVRYAEEGFPVSPVIAGDWKANEEKLAGHPVTRETYLVDGRAPAAGEVFRNPRLAAVYRRLASDLDSFYRGEVGDELARFLEAEGGLITREDLSRYRARWVEPISTVYRGYEVFQLPPNGQGLAALLMLNILEGFDLSRHRHNSAEYLHLLVEAKKLAFADVYRFISDPEFSPVPVEELLSREHSRRQRARLDLERAADYESELSWPGDTVYITAADRDGNMVSLINSIFFPFGSGVTAGETGILLQNRGSQFSLDPEHFNSLEPGKRPFHTIIPSMVFRDGQPWLSFGVMGGALQPQGHVQVLCNLIDFGMNVQQAGEAARFFHDRAELALESGIGADARHGLIDRGHRIISLKWNFGGFQGILRDPETGVYVAGSDPRKDGLAIGF